MKQQHQKQKMIMKTTRFLKKSHSEDAGDFGWSMEDSSTNVWRDICNT
jgi:hypothetical protein